MKRFKKRSAKTNITHYGVLVRRHFKQIFSNGKLFFSLLLQAPVMLIICLFVYDKDTFVDPVNLFNASTITFVFVFVGALMGVLNSYSAVCKERDILSREVFGGLDVTGYVLAKFTVLASVGLVQCLIIAAGALVFIDFPFVSPVGGALALFLSIYLVNLSVTAMGLLISAVLKNAGSAILPVLVVIVMQVVFSDCVIPIDGAARVLCYITSTMWGVALLGRACDLNSYYPVPGQMYNEIYSYEPILCVCVLAAIAVLCLLLAVVKLKIDYRSKD